MPNHSRSAAAAAANLPAVLDNQLIFWRNDIGQPYYPSVSSASPYLQEQQQNFDMGYQMSDWISPPAAAGFSPNRSFPGLGHQLPMSATRARPTEASLITAEVLNDILYNPYKYMTCPTAYRPLVNFLTHPRNIGFRDSFLLEITRSVKSLIDAICTLPGSSALQKLIKVAKKAPVMAHVTVILADYAVLLMTNQCGMHVVKKCFFELDPKLSEPLFEKVMENNKWLYIVKNEHGCRSLNYCLDYIVDSFKEKLLKLIAYNPNVLALDRFGTYVVQHAIELETKYTEEIVTNLGGTIVILSTTQHGSHVVEKCLITDYGFRVVEELLRSGKVCKLAYHEYANYVIKRAIVYARGLENVSLYNRLINQLSREKIGLQNTRFGKRVAELLPYPEDYATRSGFEKSGKRFTRLSELSSYD